MTPASAPLATAKGANAKSARMREVNEDMAHDPKENISSANDPSK
jgi:hypothetical protein